MRPEFLLRSSDGGELKGNSDERKASEDAISKIRINSSLVFDSPAISQNIVNTLFKDSRICQRLTTLSILFDYHFDDDEECADKPIDYV